MILYFIFFILINNKVKILYKYKIWSKPNYMGCTNGFIQLPLSEKQILIIDVPPLKIKHNMTEVYETNGFDNFISCFAALNVSNKNDTLNHIYFKF